MKKLLAILFVLALILGIASASDLPLEKSISDLESYDFVYQFILDSADTLSDMIGKPYAEVFDFLHGWEWDMDSSTYLRFVDTMEGSIGVAVVYSGLDVAQIAIMPTLLSGSMARTEMKLLLNHMPSEGIYTMDGISVTKYNFENSLADAKNDEYCAIWKNGDRIIAMTYFAKDPCSFYVLIQ